jgi:DNA primase
VRGEGPGALTRYIEQAVDILDRKLQILEERNWFASIDRRRDAVDKLLPTLRATADPALRDIYIDQVAERTGVRRGTLEAELNREEETARRSPAPSREGNRRPRAAYPSGARTAPRLRMGPEPRLLKVLARDRERREEHLEYAAMRIGPEDFRGEADRAIFQAFLDDPQLDGAPEEMDGRLATYLQRLLAEPADSAELAEATRVFREAVNQLAEHRLYRQMEQVQAAIEAADRDEDKAALVQQKQRLKAEAAELGVRWAPAARKYARGFNETPRGT